MHPAVDVVELNRYAPRPFVFTEVAMCLRDAIRAAGHPCEHRVNEVDPQAFSIVLGAAPASAPPGLRPDRAALFNLEQLGSPSALAGPDYRRWLGGWVVADYHSRNVELLRAENGPRQQAFELPLVPSVRLAEDLPGAGLDKTVDVLFFGTPSPRREAVLQQLEARGLRVERVAGAYAHELAPAVRRARLVLHVHFYESAFFPIARMLQPLARRVPVVCEASVFSAHDDWSASGMLFAPHAALAAECERLLAASAEQQARAQRAWAFAVRRDFGRPLERLVRALQERSRRAPPAPVPAPTSPPAAAPFLPAARTASLAATASARRDSQAEEAPLSDEEIEALLAAEEADAPASEGPPPAPFTLVRREPGQGRLGRWVAWLLVGFVLVGVANVVVRWGT